LEEFAKIHSYIARLRRREYVNGKAEPEELVMCKFRKQPWSIHFKWIGPEATGREVVYVKGRYDDKLHILTAARDIPLCPAGRRMDLARDSMLVKAASAHDITESGLGAILETNGTLIADSARGKPGCGVKYLGPTNRPEYPKPLEGIELKLPPGQLREL